MGEILAPTEGKFDPVTTLLWENVYFGPEDNILIFIPHTKTKGPKGEFIDFFPFMNNDCCPVNSLLRLRDLHISNGTFDAKRPVFMFSSGKLLTVNKMNSILNGLLADFYVKGLNKITCHSFRAGIPSTISNFPDTILVDDIKNFGRWRGSSYNLYIRLEKDRRKQLYDKIYSALNSMIE